MVLISCVFEKSPVRREPGGNFRDLRIESGVNNVTELGYKVGFVDEAAKSLSAEFVYIDIVCIT